MGALRPWDPWPYTLVCTLARYLVCRDPALP
jgi:hypothetical protein